MSDGPILKRFTVRTTDGRDHEFEAHYAFNNDGVLVFRRRETPTSDAYKVAEFNKDTWEHYFGRPVTEDEYYG
jgi:hypothetical protein